MDKAPFIFGQPDEWRQFAEQQPEFMEKLSRLHDTMQQIIARQSAHTPTPVDKVIITLGWICAHDFEEILVLCGNGLGIGGLKLLRGLYERAVTAQYLFAFPHEAQNFFDYNAIHVGKLHSHMENSLGSSKTLPKDKIETIKAARKEAEGRFQEQLCKKCGATRTQMSWSGSDLLSMASKARRQLGIKKGEGLDTLYGACYFIPTLHAHSTFFVFQDWVEFPNGGMEWQLDAERKMVGHTIRGAHLVMLQALKTQNDYFQLGFDKELETLYEDYAASWGSNERENRS